MTAPHAAAKAIPIVQVNASKIVRFPVIALGVGVTSALATAISARYLDTTSALLGLFFGLAIVLLVWLKSREYSVAFALGMVASALVAYFAAVWGGLLLADAIGAFLSRGAFGALDPRTFMIGGFIGALIVNTALLFFHSLPTGLRLARKALVWSLGGAVFGLLGSAFSHPVGTMMVTVVGRATRTQMTGNDQELAFYSAYLIWQAGMALLILLMLPPSAISETSQRVPVLRSAAQLSIPARLFFLCVFLAAVPIASEVRYYFRSWKIQFEISRIEREIPSLDNLPDVPSRPIDEMLILNGIAGYSETRATAQVLPEHTLRAGPGNELRKYAKRVDYSIGYTLVGSANVLDDRQTVTVLVSELPNGDWARYQLKNAPGFSSGAYYYLASIRVNRFGNAFLMYPATTGNYLMAFWPSGNKIVVISYSGQQAEEVVKQYLAKFPSSL